MLTQLKDCRVTTVHSFILRTVRKSYCCRAASAVPRTAAELPAVEAEALLQCRVSQMSWALILPGSASSAGGKTAANRVGRVGATCELSGQPHQFLRFVARPEDGDAGMRPRTMATSSQRCRRGQLWQSLKILSGSSDLSSTVRKPYLKKKSGMRVNRQTDWTPCSSASSISALEDASAGALALGLRLHDDGAHLTEMRAVEVQRAAAQKDAAIGLGHGEVADVFADLREGALEQRAVAGERVHQIVDVGGILEQGLTHQHGRPPHAGFCRAPRRAPKRRQAPATRCARRSADDIVAIERRVERDSCEKVLVELGAKLAQLVEREIVQLDAFFEGEAHRVADLLVRSAERNALVDEIGSRGHGVQIAGLRSFAHALAIELKRRGKARHQREHLRHKLDGKSRLLGLLHVFIVGQRQAFELQRHCLRRAMNAADFGAQQLGESGFFFCGMALEPVEKASGSIDKTVLGRGEKRDLLGKPAQVQADKGERLRYSRMKSRSLVASMELAVGAVNPARARRCCGRAPALRRPPRLNRRAKIKPLRAIVQARRVAQSHLHVGQQPVRDQYGLGALQVRVAGHNIFARGARLTDQRPSPGGETSMTSSICGRT